MASRAERLSEFHDRGENPIYELVPSLCLELFDLPAFPSVEAFVFGGSYANGHWEEADDIDVDIIHTKLVDPQTTRFIHFVSAGLFHENDLELNIRVSMDRTGRVFHWSSSKPEMKPLIYELEIGEEEVRLLYCVRHPGSPYIARNQEAVEFWRLSEADWTIGGHTAEQMRAALPLFDEI